MAAQDESQALLKRHIDEMHAREGVTKRDLERRAIFARALKRYRCGTGASSLLLVDVDDDVEGSGADPAPLLFAHRPCLRQGRHLAERPPLERPRRLQPDLSPLRRYVAVFSLPRAWASTS